MPDQIYHSDAPFTLEAGRTLPAFHLAYTTQGDLNLNKENVVWIFHALTANSDATEWWSGLVGDGKIFNPAEHFILCVNMPGSCYGSTGPLEMDVEEPEISFHNFPFFTIKDMVAVYERLRIHLGIEKIHVGIGGSMGGQQLLEWAVTSPNLFEYIFPIATNAQHSPWAIAINESQRLSIELDPSWPESNAGAGMEGMKVARSVALLSYRNYITYNAGQQEASNETFDNFRTASYQKYQGLKLAKRFNAFSYYFLSKGMDSHNVGRGRESVENALAGINSKALVIGISTDILFPIIEQQRIATSIPKAEFATIHSDYGHDGFLLEFERISTLIEDFMGSHEKAGQEKKPVSLPFKKKLVVGLFGFGTVGEGFYKVLHQTASMNAVIKKICIKNVHKKRNAPMSLFTTERDELLNDKEINVIVEVIDNSEDAFYIASAAMRNGKAIVSASKKMIAEHLSELLSLQLKSGVPFLYESAACASIPVIRNLEEYYDNDLLESITGIVNGSTNYILTKIFDDGLSFATALQSAQQLGFAESNPDFDVLGIDAVNKLTLLLVHAYGIIAEPDSLLYSGINNISKADARIAVERDCQIKLTARAVKLKNGSVTAFVLPQFVKSDSQLFNVKNEFNGIVIKSSFADEQFFYGKGAGSLPTASAVLSDISALSYDYRYEYKKLRYHVPPVFTTDFYLKIYISFPELQSVDKEKFEWIEEFYNSPEGCYLIGVINFGKLVKTTWWKQDGISLIVMPDAIIEDIELRSLKKRSLNLAGIS